MGRDGEGAFEKQKDKKRPAGLAAGLSRKWEEVTLLIWIG